MAAFAYEALDLAGKTKKGVLEGDNARQIRAQLREQKLIPVEVEQVKDTPARTASFDLSRLVSRHRISAAELALLTRQLATLVESGLPIEEALFAVAEQAEKARQKKMLMAVRSRVVEGYTLADALREFPSIFDDLFVAMVAAGEKSGHLDTVLERLADYTENREKTRSQIVQALVYPVIMLVFALGIVIMLLTVVVPKIVGQFDHMGQDLPTMTQILMDISAFVQNHGGLLALCLVVLGVALSKLLTIPHIQLRYHQWILSLPLIGRVNRGLNTARFARTLSILTASAVPLLEAMRIASDVLANRYIKREVGVAAMQVKEGASLRASLERTKIFPPMMMHMIAAGEKSGELQGMLARAADNQDREFESLVNISLKVFEPFLIVFMATIVLFIVLAILQPILALNSMVNL
jgi:general secretion pathway protein F